MRFEELLHFVEHEMRMSHVYQPVMLRELLARGGRASRQEIARALLNEDRSQLEYYSEITRDMVGRVLTNRGLAQRDESGYELPGYENLTPEQVGQLTAVCNRKLSEYVERRGDAIWQHRRQATGYISGSLRYDVLKRAKFRCELCGISADERALEVDHIVPRNKKGDDDLSNLQALCYSCNAMKRDRDDTDFRAVRAAYEHRDSKCPFCATGDRTIELQNRLAMVLSDAFPVTEGHALVIPKRHTPDYFDLGTAEMRACQQLIGEMRAALLKRDSSIEGFNVGVNSGTAAGQTVMHCHIHVIPRRRGDSPNPRGGVRAVIPQKGDYPDSGRQK